MKSTTSLVASQYRLQEWAMQIQDCQNRPSTMKVEDWCKDNGITKSCYYYRLRKVRQACLDTFTDNRESQEIVDISDRLSEPHEDSTESMTVPGIDIHFSNCTVHVSEMTPLGLLSDVIRVIANAQ